MSDPRSRAGSGSTFWVFIDLTAAHFLLGFAMSKSPSLATAHAVLSVLAAASLGLASGSVELVLAAAAYVAGSDVLWRMCQASVFHETAKYGAVLTLGLAFLRIKNRGTWLPALYFALLIPAVAAPIFFLDTHDARSRVSANLSGPLVVTIASLVFSRLSLKPSTLKLIAGSLLLPTISSWGAVVAGITGAERLTFTGGSSHQTSGGFGPNQVSLNLSLGALGLILAVLTRERKTSAFRSSVLLLGGIAISAQSALTFSRGGLYTLACALFAASLFLARGSQRLAVVGVGLMTGLVGYFVVVPWLDSFTQGAILARFADTGTTNRIDIAVEDLSMFAEHPWFGVGVGLSTSLREIAAAPHTEYTRLLAEHGMLGLLALSLLLLMSFWGISRTPKGVTRSVAAAFIVWSLFSMIHAAMRTAAPAFALAFGFYALRKVAADETQPNEETQQPSGVER